MEPTVSNISGMIAAAKQSRSVNAIPSQILPIVAALNDAVTDLQQRVTKLEGNMLKEANVLTNPNVLK